MMAEYRPPSRSTTAPATAAKCQAATPEQRELRVGPDTCCEGDALTRTVNETPGRGGNRAPGEGAFIRWLGPGTNMSTIISPASTFNSTIRSTGCCASDWRQWWAVESGRVGSDWPSVIGLHLTIVDQLRDA